MIKQQIEQDLKTALLGGDKDRVMTLRGLKSAILYAEVAGGLREKGLPEDEVIALLAKEAKKRQESADLYTQGGSADRAAAELAEKEIIETYLPAKLSDEELKQIVEKAVTGTGAASIQQMGQVIAAVKKETQGAADGARIAQLVKERLAQ
ncbi:MAG TPA: GatB/YqeY domain-containing protein [Candidatus Saccharimonadales bacterium]